MRPFRVHQVDCLKLNKYLNWITIDEVEIVECMGTRRADGRWYSMVVVYGNSVV